MTHSLRQPKQSPSSLDQHVVQIGSLEDIESLSLAQLALRRLRRDYLTLGAIFVLAILGLSALFAPVISEEIFGVDYRKTNVETKFQPIGAAGHLLGSDDLGRDHLARLLEGGRVSLGVAFGSAFLSLIIGTSLGVISGYYQGTNLRLIDDGLMWFVTTLNSIPALYLLILIASVLKPTVISLILILSIFSWTFTMRLVRGQTLSLRETEYIVAARAMGAGAPRIMFSHILPNIYSVIMVDLASNIGFLILTESSLSFLGLGIREPTPSWGNMLSKAQSFFRAGPHLVIFPGALIVITVLCLYLIGDGLRDAFDPKLSRK